MKRFLGVACALLILFVNAPMAFAASSSPADAVDTENFDDALEYISSQEVKSQIYNEIDFNKEGTQSIDVGNGIIFSIFSYNYSLRVAMNCLAIAFAILAAVFGKTKKKITIIRILLSAAIIIFILVFGMENNAIS